VLKQQRRDELVICHYMKEPQWSVPRVQHKTELREFSPYQFKFPYVITCKGNSEFIIHCLPYHEKTLIFPLKEYFVGFIEQSHLAAGDSYFTSDVLFENYTIVNQDIKNVDRLIKLDKEAFQKSKHIIFTFFSLSNEGYHLNKLILFPHAFMTFEDQKCLHLKHRKVIKIKNLVDKWKIKSFMAQIQVPYKNSLIWSDILFTQYKDYIQIIVMEADQSKYIIHETGDNLLPITMVETDIS
jgi:hypothetical protein